MSFYVIKAIRWRTARCTFDGVVCMFKWPIKSYFLHCIAKAKEIEKIDMNEQIFRWMLNEDEMSTDKLSEGIRKFKADGRKLEDLIRAKLQE